MFIFLYRVIAGLNLIHSILYSNRINQEGSSSRVFEAMAEKTLLEFSAPIVENIHTCPVLRTEDLEFELKPSLINMVQAIQYSGKANECLRSLSIKFNYQINKEKDPNEINI